MVSPTIAGSAGVSGTHPIARDTGAGTGTRVRSVDILRGAVMVLMAIDHVRVYSGVPPGSATDTGVFLTRWVTHFCAPVFVFLAGASAYLHGRRLASKGALARFLVVRGVWLILLELTVFRVAWTFNFDFGVYLLAGVIWMIGWSMIALAGLQWLGVRGSAVFGVAMIAGHDGLGAVFGGAMESSGASWLWQIFYLGGPVQVSDSGPVLAVLYSLVPWIGVMSTGYAFGAILEREPAKRRSACMRIGGAAILLFVVLRAFHAYGDPRPWSGEQGPAWISFLSTSKYPASLLFLLMTLGPAIALLPLLESAQGVLARVVAVFGRVPFFFYSLHVVLIHAIFVLLSVIRFGEVIPWMTANHPMMAGRPPDGYAYGLRALYAITVIVVVALYVPCRWLAGVKSRRKDAWLSFV